MPNEKLVCTPDLVVSNLRLNDFSNHVSGKEIQVSERLCLVPPILTDVQEACSAVAENFRKISQMIVDRIDETRLNIMKIMDQVDSVSVESYQKQFHHILCEINQSICTMNTAKHKLMVDRVNLMGQIKAPITATALASNSHTLTAKSSPQSRIILKMPKVSNMVSQQDTLAESMATNATAAASTTGTTIITDIMDTSLNSAVLLPSFHSIPTFDNFFESSNNNNLMSSTSPNSAIDDEIAAKKAEQNRIRRAKNLRKRLMKKMRPCKVKLIRQDLNKMKEELMQQYGTFLTNNENRNGFVVQDENEDKDEGAVNVIAIPAATTGDTTTTITTNNDDTVPDIHKDTENSSNSLNGCIVTNHIDNYSSLKNSILVTTSLNVNKSQKSVSFAPDVIDKSSS